MDSYRTAADYQGHADRTAADLMRPAWGWPTSDDRKRAQEWYRDASRIAAAKTPQPADTPRPA
ncbi:hypothetical protein ACLIYM_25265 [Streptomyces fenghuangensis]